MASSSQLLGFFTQMSNMGGIIVKGWPVPHPLNMFAVVSTANVVPDEPKLDLDLYIQNYTGRTRYDRLILIGKSSVALCVDALKAAEAEAKAGTDVTRYREAWDCLRVAAPGEPKAQKDNGWIEATERANKAETARLEAELKGYKHNLIKESIRMGNEDLGRHFESIGYLNEAAEAYSRMRQDVSTTKHIVDCGKHLVSVSLQRRDWTMVLNNLGKITGVQGSNSDEDKAANVYIRAVSGIGLLGLCHYYEAAKSFLNADPSVPAATYSHVLSPNDIAIYGGLLALATMDRTELQTRVLDNQSFRTYLEHEPHIRKAISLFVNGRYSSCLAILESVRSDYLLDIYLQRHVPVLYSKIRSKSIVQYFVPFSCVTLASLNEAFAREGESIEQELAAMIRAGTLKARLDTRDKLLIAVVSDPRREMQKKALEVAAHYEQEAKERLRRMSLVAAGLEVVGKKQHGGSGPRPGIDEAWYDDAKPLASGAEAQN
ncbi:COP9 signalosome complex subunit 1 [Neonectria ditissima]|uniref:COP9 signalosome complex subunit 1 n=1 Tax=Neonectria ditissima TaxID=78410 RepID=A0A0P7BBD0_9HYPO|nr:COP9 signalosome complex subunit 1 [Neonectria ditissima]